jgi:hypothetical protein
MLGVFAARAATGRDSLATRLRIVVYSGTLSVLVVSAAVAATESVRDRYEQLHARWANQIEQLATKYETQGPDDAVQAIRQLRRTTDSGVISIPVIATNGQSAATATSQATKQEWQLALTRVRKQYAKDLYELATNAFRAGDISFCYDLVREVLEHDPDHGPARSLMGFTRHRDQWVTPFAAGKLKTGQVWDARFGWVTKSHVARYEKGEQLWKGQWLPVEEVAKYRNQWANAWEVETEHYVIRTNASLERGVEFGAKLEKLYAIFFRLFAGFFSPRDQLAMLFDPPNRRTAIGKIDEPDRRPTKKFRVYFYRTRDEFLETLRPHVKTGLEVSTGLYLTGTRTAYFYVHEQMDEATVIHEATHQLFSESREHRHGDGSRGNFWVIEGIACYMESFRDRGGHVELGAWDTPRLKRGRTRIEKLIPLEKLVQLGMKDFDGEEIYDLYAQSACLCHFLMHHENGRYRDVFVKYLEEVYLGRAEHQTLAEILGVDYASLDRQFRQHVAEGKY